MYMGCIFCEIVKGTSPCYKIRETDNAMAILDINPDAKGHALVISKSHCDDISGADKTTLFDMIFLSQWLVDSLRKNFRVTNIQIQSWQGPGVQRPRHFHIHVCPEDGEERFVPSPNYFKQTLEKFLK